MKHSHEVSHLLYVKEIQDFTNQFYRPGSFTHSLRRVWRNHVLKRYYISLPTLRTIMKIDTSNLEQRCIEYAQSALQADEKQTRQQRTVPTGPTGKEL